MTGASRFGHMYAPLRVANYRNFLLGQTISTMGSLIQMTAQSWVVYELTRSSAALGTIAMLGSLPLLLVPPFTTCVLCCENVRILRRWHCRAGRP